MPTRTSEAIIAVMERMRGAARAAFVSLLLACSPVPAPRPRVMKFGGVYYPGKYTPFVVELQKSLAAVKGQVVDGPLMLTLEVIREKPKAGKTLLPRGDCDNLGKGPMDALTKAKSVYEDDDQIAVLLVAKRYALDGEAAGIRFDWAPLPAA